MVKKRIVNFALTVVLLASVADLCANNASAFWRGTLSFATDVLSDIVADVLSGNGVTKEELASHRRKIAQLERRLNKISQNRDYPSISEFNQLKRTVNGLNDVYSSLARRLDRLKGDVRSLRSEFNTFKSAISSDVATISSNLQRLESSYQSHLQRTSIGSFTIHNVLGPDQCIENVDVFINGRFAGKLIVNTFYPQSSLQLNITGAGTFQYTVVAEAVFINQYGQLYTDSIRSSGSVYANRGSHFELMRTRAGVQLIAR